MRLISTLVLLYGSISFGSSLETGLILHYKFDEGAGTTISDSSTSGNDHSGTWGSDSSWNVSGQIDGALDHAPNGSGDEHVIELSGATDNDLLFLNRSAFTFATWIYYRSGDTLGRVASMLSYGPNEGYFFIVNTTNGAALNRYRGGSNDFVNMGEPLPTNSWHHIAATYDGSTMKIFFDGIEKGSTSSTLNIIDDGANFSIGAHSGLHTLNAKLDDFRVYNRGLTPNEVRALAEPCPSGEEKEIEYVNAENRFRWCDGVNYWSASSRSSVGACGTSGRYYYEDANNRMVHCDGSDLYPWGPPGAGGAGCSSPSALKGALEYDTSNSKYIYCDGTNWVDVGS